MLFRSLFYISLHSGLLAIRFASALTVSEDLGNELEEKNIALSRLDTLKDEFIANTTHELCTPLSGIIGIAESMIAGAVGDLSKRAVQNLEMLVASGKRLNGLVNNILDYSRLKNRDIQLQLSPLDIHGLSEIALKLLTPLAEAKGLRLVNGIRGETPLVMADENRLHQIYSNLIGNAIKYTPKGQITVFAEVLKDRMQISVKDTGMGIVEEKHKDIFLQFEQIRSKTSENIEGTGLGLSITRHLVELHGGVISLESLVGRGTTFYFTLPLADISKGAAAPLLSADMKLSRTAKIPIPVIIPEAPSHVSPLSGVKPVILIVDDDPINLQVAANHLIHEGFDVKTAPSGEQALRMIPPKNVPDLVLLDIMMPGMDGYEVCHRLRETHSMSALPIVMLTARNRPQDMFKGFEVGAKDYLTKPFARGELLARVKAQLKLRCAYNVIKENASLKRTLAQHTEIREEIGSEKPLSHHLGDSDRKIPLQARTLPNETRPASNSMGLDKKELGVRVMSLAIHLWHHETGMTKIDLARQSGIWKVYMSKNGFERAQTLDKYLNTENFPKQPRWATVHDTVDFVLQSCKMPSPLRNQVENSILALKELG